MQRAVLILLLIVTSSLANLRDYSLDSFTEMIRENLLKTESYVAPIDNSKIATVEDETIQDYGTFDFIVIGAGSAGTLLTRRLTEISDWRVLLLEAGGPETDFSDVPGMTAYIQNSDMNWGYTTVPQTTCCLGMKNNSCVTPRGKVLGGSSVINAKMYVRGNRNDYDLWAAMGNEGWSYEEVLPYFKKTENLMVSGGDPGYHKAGGLLSVKTLPPNSFTEMYLGGMDELGYELIDYNGEEQCGYNRAYATLSDVGIASGGRAFIENILHRTNMNVTLHAYVTKVIIDSQNRAEGVEFIRHGKKYRANATMEVILSAGSINTPQILMLSGIGPKDELDKFNIDIVRDLPVGKNLQDHPCFIGVPINTNITRYNNSLKDNCDAYLNHQRPFTAALGADSMAFFKVDNSSLRPDFQHMTLIPPAFGYSPSQAINANEEIKAAIDSRYQVFQDMFVLVILLHETSRGSVTLKSNDPNDFPLIDYHFFSDPLGEDIEIMYQAVRKALELLDTDSFKAANAKLVDFVPPCDIYAKDSREFWYCAIRLITTTIYHPCGTTRMGDSEATSVVDPYLRIHGMANMRVIDAGVMPEIPSGNINAAVYMVAEKGADMIKQYYGVL